MRTPGGRLDPEAHHDAALAGQRAVREGHVVDAAGRLRDVDLEQGAARGRRVERHAVRIIAAADDRPDRPSGGIGGRGLGRSAVSAGCREESEGGEGCCA
jgi:hypothetical protein